MMPRGHKAPRELKLSQAQSTYLPPAIKHNLTNWWLIHRRGANTPNWDLVTTCKINGESGLVLVEGKAHVGELEWPGKS